MSQDRTPDWHMSPNLVGSHFLFPVSLMCDTSPWDYIWGVWVVKYLQKNSCKKNYFAGMPIQTRFTIIRSMFQYTDMFQYSTLIWHNVGKHLQTRHVWQIFQSAPTGITFCIIIIPLSPLPCFLLGLLYGNLDRKNSRASGGCRFPISCVSFNGPPTWPIP